MLEAIASQISAWTFKYMQHEETKRYQGSIEEKTEKIAITESALHADMEICSKNLFEVFSPYLRPLVSNTLFSVVHMPFKL